MSQKIKSVLTILLLGGTLIGLAAAFFIQDPKEYSETERRLLATMPEWEFSDQYVEALEDYTLDQFPLREGFRKMNALSSKYLFGQKDNHGFYAWNGYLSELNYPMEEGTLKRNLSVLSEVYEQSIKNTDCSVYCTIIPDKNYYIAERSDYPAVDYPKLYQQVGEQLKFAEMIDVAETLTMESFYRTDQHIRQECLADTVKELALAMNTEIRQSYQVQKVDRKFYGAYYGQAALPAQGDDLYYVTNDVLNHCVVTSYNTGMPELIPLYDMEKANGRDPYEMFLNGADALITIENPQAQNDKELVIFRDSFGSNLTPLLIPGYAKITLVDLRYIQKDVLGYFVDFDRQDVLFLYSTLTLNNTISMQQ